MSILGLRTLLRYAILFCLVVTLNGADIGILLREKNIINVAVCLTKFVEYVTCGLYVILTEKIGDVSGIAGKEKIDEVVKSSLEESEMKSVVNKILAKRVEIQKKGNKERIAQFVQAKYS